MLHANNIGHMVGAPRDARRPNRQHVYRNCPTCGGLMTEHATQCMECSNREDAERIEAEGDAKRIAAMMERHHRWTAALDAGWDWRELWYLAREGALPTWEEILQRSPSTVIRSWWRGTHYGA